MVRNYNIPQNKDNPDVESMFDLIARRYDLLNHLLSFGVDRQWRKRAIDKIPGKYLNPKIIDVATGTGDFAIEAARLNPDKITGIDISENMLAKGRRKIAAKNLEDKIELIKCDSMKICFDDNLFDIATVAFGVRNFSDPAGGLAEIRRVLKPGGFILILEFSKPDGFIFKHLYEIYFRYILPFTGALVSRHREAYKYLNQSVTDFMDGQRFMSMMTGAGFSDVNQMRLTRGIATVYTGVNK